MIEVVDTKVESGLLAGERELVIRVTGSCVRYSECHPSALEDKDGKYLTQERLHSLIRENGGITCVSFIGGDGDVASLTDLAFCVKMNCPQMKLCWHCDAPYDKDLRILELLDYLRYDKMLLRIRHGKNIGETTMERI